jgi:hypothetical protein
VIGHYNCRYVFSEYAEMVNKRQMIEDQIDEIMLQNRTYFKKTLGTIDFKNPPRIPHKLLEEHSRLNSSIRAYEKKNLA